MLETVKNEAKSKEDALAKSLEELNVREDEAYYFFEEDQGGIFKGKRFSCVLTTKYAVKDFIRKFLNDLAYKMGTKFSIEIKESEHGYNVMVIADDNAILIGKNGKNLSSIQTILRQALSVYGNFGIKVNLDVSDYKARREKKIIREVHDICHEIKKTKVDVKLDPMNSYERRIVHNVVGRFEHLISESEGDSPNRCVVIKYKA